jgi:hypothetical protein
MTKKPSCQLNFDDYEPVKPVEPAEPVESAKAFNPAEKICHGQPMRKINLAADRVGYKCDECLTMMETRK